MTACPLWVLGPLNCEPAPRPTHLPPSQDGIVWAGQCAAVAAPRWGAALLRCGPGGAPRSGVHRPGLWASPGWPHAVSTPLPPPSLKARRPAPAATALTCRSLAATCAAAAATSWKLTTSAWPCGMLPASCPCRRPVTPSHRSRPSVRVGGPCCAGGGALLLGADPAPPTQAPASPSAASASPGPRAPWAPRMATCASGRWTSPPSSWRQVGPAHHLAPGVAQEGRVPRLDSVGLHGAVS